MLGNEIHFLYEYPTWDDLRLKYVSACTRVSANVHSVIHMLQTSEPDKIYDRAKFILYSLKLYGQ